MRVLNGYGKFSASSSSADRCLHGAISLTRMASRSPIAAVAMPAIEHAFADPLPDRLYIDADLLIAVIADGEPVLA